MIIRSTGCLDNLKSGAANDGAFDYRPKSRPEQFTTNQAAIAGLFRVINRYVGNLPPMPGVFPDFPAPVIRDVGNGRQDEPRIFFDHGTGSTGTGNSAPEFLTRRIAHSFRQHRVKLVLGEFLGLRRYWLARRHHLIHRAATGSQLRRLSLRHRHQGLLKSLTRLREYLGFGCWRLVTALQTNALQLGAHGVAAVAQPGRDLPGTVATGPKLFEQPYVFLIPTHEGPYTPTATYRLVGALGALTNR
jgi:hypothetical protein